MDSCPVSPPHHIILWSWYWEALNSGAFGKSQIWHENFVNKIFGAASANLHTLRKLHGILQLSGSQGYRARVTQDAGGLLKKYIYKILNISLGCLSLHFQQNN